jgi:hypothetical protein
MALIVETGAIVSGAESLASVAAADAHHAARGNAAWGVLSTGDKEIALRKATDYMQERYSDSWRGVRVSSTQALDWPRSCVYRGVYPVASNIIPDEVIKACCELALRASAKALTDDEGAQVKSEKVDVLETVYADGARQQTRYAAVDNLLTPLLGSSSSIRLVRA